MKSSSKIEKLERHLVVHADQSLKAFLAFFWTDCPDCDVVFIKTSGIDFLSYEPELNTLRLVEAKKFNVSWYIYTHETRMVLLASGMQCTSFYGFQLSSAGVVRLPKFEMTLCKPEANQKPVLAAEDVHLITINGRIYCLQVDRVSMLLNLYRFYRDAVVQQIIEPSKEVALQLLESDRQNLQTRKLGIEMLRQLCLHHEYVNILLQDGRYLESLRYARKNKVITVQPLFFLEAAVSSSNPQHLAAVLRFFSDFTPGFQSTSQNTTGSSEF